jgi:hypothetical protein
MRPDLRASQSEQSRGAPGLVIADDAGPGVPLLVMVGGHRDVLRWGIRKVASVRVRAGYRLVSPLPAQSNWAPPERAGGRRVEEKLDHRQPEAVMALMTVSP